MKNRKKTERNVWRGYREKLIKKWRKDKIFLESFGRQSEEIVHKGKGINENKIEYSSKNEGVNVMYTNIDGLLHRK